MKIHEYLEDKTLGFGNSHPDDLIAHPHLVYAARGLGIPMHELVHTKGKNATDNFRAHERPRFRVYKGHREDEGRATAAYMGIKSYVQYDSEDGALSKRTAALASVTASWVRKKGINVLATLATGDHVDHTAAVEIARHASAILMQQGYELELLELLPPGYAEPDSLWIEATPNSMELAFGGAAQNRSQFEIFPDIRRGWPIVPGGMSMEPQSFNRLRQYPLLMDAAYRFVPAGQLAVAQNVPADAVY